MGAATFLSCNFPLRLWVVKKVFPPSFAGKTSVRFKISCKSDQRALDVAPWYEEGLPQRVVMELIVTTT